MRNAPIRAISMDLIALEFGALERRGIDDDAAARINFARHQERALAAVIENFHQHLNHVVVGVLVVIQQNDVIPRNVLLAGPGLRLALSSGCNDFHKIKKHNPAPRNYAPDLN